MKLKEYNNIEDMFQSHNEVLNEINNTIEDSYYTYSEYAERMGYSIKDDVIDENSFEFDGEELGYSSYTTKANIISEELQYDNGDSFRIGNNIAGGI